MDNSSTIPQCEYVTYYRPFDKFALEKRTIVKDDDIKMGNTKSNYSNDSGVGSEDSCAINNGNDRIRNNNGRVIRYSTSSPLEKKFRDNAKPYIV